MLMLACPKSSCTYFGCFPILSSIVAHVWRRSWSLISGRPARLSRGLNCPTLVFANNSHLRKDRSGFLLPAEWGGGTVSWWGAGAIAGAWMGDQYAFLASALGSAPERGLEVPIPDTLEGALYAVAEGRCIFDSKRLAEAARDRSPKLAPRTDASTVRGYSPLDPDRLDGTDGIVFVKNVPYR
jgi:hypothetical protein